MDAVVCQAGGPYGSQATRQRHQPAASLPRYFCLIASAQPECCITSHTATCMPCNEGPSARVVFAGTFVKTAKKCGTSGYCNKCCGGSTCCDASQSCCGSLCLTAGWECCGNGKLTCAPGQTCCGTTCCGKGSTCVGGKTCVKGTVPFSSHKWKLDRPCYEFLPITMPAWCFHCGGPGLPCTSLDAHGM